jgi:dephospho-CoA kinase
MNEGDAGPGRRVARVALTGGIATGKSYVRAQLERLGVPTNDADALARAAVLPGSPGLQAVIERFGSGLLEPSGALNRGALGRLVFADPGARRDLEAIIHPIVRAATERWFAGLDPEAHAFAVADIPLLYETGRDRDFDAVIVTACDPATQIRRIRERDGLSDSEAGLRVAAQLPLGEKIRRADYVITTDGTFDETDRQVRDVHHRLSASGPRA